MTRRVNVEGAYLYVLEHEIAAYEAAGWICVGTLPRHHADRGWLIWKP